MHINRKGLQFSKRDTWDSSTLAAIIVKWLEKYKESHNSCEFKGCPASYLPDLSKGEHTDEEIEEGKKLFMADIDKMIFAFSHDDIPDDCWLVEPDFDACLNGEGLDFNAGELDWEKIEAHRAKIEEGRKLFAEKFDCLWI